MKYSTVWRTIVGWGLGLSLTIVLIPPAILAFIVDPVKQRLIQPMIRFWGRMIIRFCCLDVTIIGRENVKDLKSAVIVSNHQSLLDLFIVTGYIPINAGFLAKTSTIWIPIVGQLMLLFGHIRVDRSSPRRSLASINRCIKAIESGWSIIIFPEGTRTEDGNIAPFKSGSLKIPLRTGSPVVPVTLTGLYNVMKKRTFAVNKHPVTIHIGKPIPTTDLEVCDFRQFVRKVENSIRENAVRLQKEHSGKSPE